MLTNSAHGTQRTTVFGHFDHLVVSGADRPVADGLSAGGLKVPWGEHHRLPTAGDFRPKAAGPKDGTTGQRPLDRSGDRARTRRVHALAPIGRRQRGNIGANQKCRLWTAGTHPAEEPWIQFSGRF